MAHPTEPPRPVQDIFTTRSNELLARHGMEDLDFILNERRLHWYGHVECFNGAVKTAFESVSLGGPRWHGSSWQRGIAESGSSWLSTLMIVIPGDLVLDLPCLLQASYLEGGPLMWILPLYLHVNQKSDDDNDDDGDDDIYICYYEFSSFWKAPYYSKIDIFYARKVS